MSSAPAVVATSVDKKGNDDEIRMTTDGEIHTFHSTFPGKFFCEVHGTTTKTLVMQTSDVDVSSISLWRLLFCLPKDDTVTVSVTLTGIQGTKPVELKRTFAGVPFRRPKGVAANIA